MEGESGVTRNIIDELNSSDIQRYQITGENGVTRSIIDKLHSSDIQQDQMKGQSGVSRSTIDERNSPDIQGVQMEGESMVLHEVSSMTFILWIFKEIKWKVKVVLLIVSLMNFVLGI